VPVEKSINPEDEQEETLVQPYAQTDIEFVVGWYGKFPPEESFHDHAYGN
jgi:hypothetical protein